MNGAMCRTSRNCVDSALSHSPNPIAVGARQPDEHRQERDLGGGATP